MINPSKGKKVKNPTCRFLTSYDGVTRCRERQYFHGFCEFHFEAYLRREIDAAGHISENLSDQKRRREINYYGIELPPAVPEFIRARLLDGGEEDR